MYMFLITKASFDNFQCLASLHIDFFKAFLIYMQ